MPFVNHRVFSPPEDRGLTIWRYLDLPRLLNLVQHRALWFARGDQLGDPWEGSLSAATFREHGANTPRIARSWLLKAAVNCWHLGEHESVAMWERYGRSSAPVAIRSTVQRLIDALNASQEVVFIGEVSYIDYDNVAMSVDNAMYPILHKRLSYSFEHELRAVTIIPSPADAGTIDLSNNPLGLYVAVDLMRLIEAIYVAPTSPAWFVETVTDAVRTALGVDVPVRQSRLGEEALF